MNAEYSCLACGTVIPLEDVNVASDVALCRKCGYASEFSLVCDISSLADEGTGEPPRGVRVERSLMGDGITIIHKRVSPLVLFFIPFTLVWSWVTLGSIYESHFRSGTLNLWQLTLEIPFLIANVVLVYLTVFGLFGKHVVTLRRDEGTIFRGIGKLGRMRRFTHSRDSRISLLQSAPQVDEIVVLNKGGTFKMCAEIPDTPKRFIAGLIQREIARGI